MRNLVLLTLAKMSDTKSEELLQLLTCGKIIEFVIDLVKNRADEDRDPSHEESLIKIISNFSTSE